MGVELHDGGVTVAVEDTLSTQPVAAGPPPARLGPRGWLRWGWRQLTSMRTALLLLFALAVAAVPGSLLPQRGLNPFKVAEFFRAHRTLAPLLDRVSLFDVYGAPWFAATYLLLFTSLAGCVIPRTRQHWQAMRAQPPPAPRNLDRLPESAVRTVAAGAADVAAAAERVLRERRFRVVRDGGPDAPVLRAEKGYLRETGNLLFHLALLALLAAVAVGSLLGFRGNVLVVEGGGFANTVTQYDGFTPGRWFSAARLAPFSFTLRDFRATYQETGGQQGAARSFDARLEVLRSPQAPPESFDLRVNHPLRVGGTKVFLVGHGYAPRVTVRDGGGQVVFRGAVPFLPQDGTFTSTGVVKVPDAAPEQLGFSGFFLPTAVVDPQRGPRSVFPAARNPALVLTGYHGNLGLDSGAAQSVYRLDMRRLTQLRKADGTPWAEALAPGQTRTLPDRLGSISFDGYAEWATFSVASDPGKALALGSAAAAIAGLLLSLGVRRRRVWVRVAADAERRTVVAAGGLARNDTGAFTDEFRDLVAAIDDAAGATGPPDRHARQLDPTDGGATR